MKSLTHTEIKWIISELKVSAAVNRNGIGPGTPDVEKRMRELWAANLESVTERLQAALDNGDKRIAID